MKYTVISDDSGSEYVVDTVEVTCTCRHFQYRLRNYNPQSPDRQCKHLQLYSEEIKKDAVVDKVRYERQEFNPIWNEISYIVKTLFPDLTLSEPLGSYRRGENLVSDLDILITKPVGVDEEYFNSELNKFYDYISIGTECRWRGDLKATYIFDKKYQVDFKVVPLESLPFAMMHFTGSKLENIRLRSIAKSLGFQLNEYGLIGYEGPVITSEEQVYEVLGQPYKRPIER